MFHVNKNKQTTQNQKKNEPNQNKSRRILLSCLVLSCTQNTQREERKNENKPTLSSGAKNSKQPITATPAKVPAMMLMIPNNHEDTNNVPTGTYKHSERDMHEKTVKLC
jgi:hypothetical protein